jgi:capsular exopolysaccharide synthesis family protein
MAGEIDISRRNEIQAAEAGMALRVDGMAAPVMVHPHGAGLLQVLWRRKLIILICLLLSVGGAFAYIEAGQRGYLEMARPMFKSSSRIYIQQSGPKIMSSDEGGDRNSGNYLNTECQIIRSGPILNAALLAPGIQDMRTFAGTDSTLDVLARGLSVEPGKNDDLVTVTFESYYPEDTAAVTDAVVNAYVDNRSKSKRNTAAEILGILQKEKVKRDGEIEDSLKALLDFKKAHPELGFQGEKGSTIVMKLDRLSTALTEAELQLIDANAEYQSVMSMKNDPAKLRQFLETKRAVGGVFVSTQDETSRLQSEIIGLEADQTALQLQQNHYQKTHPNYKTIGERIEVLQKRIGAVKTRIDALKTKNQGQETEQEKAFAASQLLLVQGRYDAARQKYERTKLAYDEQLKAATGLNSVMADYVRLENAWQKASKLAEVVDQRIRELNVTEDVGALNISVLERAARPNSPFKPERTRVAVIAVALGLLAGVGLAMLRNIMDKRLVSAEEVPHRLGVPVLGVLPRVKSVKAGQQLGRMALDSPSTPVVEAYRAIRTILHFGSHASGARKILVTSPMSGEGKSTLVSNLAILMAQAGHRVLVVDADLRIPHQHEIFRVPNDVGLAGLLNGRASCEQAICHCSNGGPDILPAGRLEGNPSAYLNTQVFLKLMSGLGSSYDTVLVDSPPVMLATDSLVLAAVCDGTILVVRSGHSSRDLARDSIEGLLGVGARVLGAVVNGQRKPRGNHYYPGYYPGRNGDGNGNGKVVAVSVPPDGAAAK